MTDIKTWARSVSNRALGAGLITEEPCSACGSLIDLEMHHPDYREPMLVSWLCRNHHRQLHRMMKLLGEKVPGEDEELSIPA